MKRIAGLILSGTAMIASVCSCNESELYIPEGPWTELTAEVSGNQTWYVPSDFTGISFESDAILPDYRGVKGRFFTPSNTQLVTLFRNSGVEILRVGGGTVEETRLCAYDRESIDSVFAFARAADVKIVYSFPLLVGDAEKNAETARYIYDNYRDLLYCFTVGNEPNCPPYWNMDIIPHEKTPIKNYEEYFAKWKSFVDKIVEAVPEATFTGPESGGWNWTEDFARDVKDYGNITYVTHHQYPGGKPLVKGTNTPLSPAQAIEAMLSPEWLAGEYNYIQSHSGDLVHKYGYRCRLTEANDHLGGIPGASNAFSGALWALDYMHWQAVHGAAGINFHNNLWLTTCTFSHDPDWNYIVSPKALAIRAFDIVAGGSVLETEVECADSCNVNVYPVLGDDGYLYVTVVNKEYGDAGRGATVKIAPEIPTKGRAEVMYMVAPENDPAAMTGCTLGDDTMENDRLWQGTWRKGPKAAEGSYTVTLPKASAAVVRIALK